MAVAYAPFDENGDVPVRPPRVLNKEKLMPVSDNTECNYIAMFFVAGVFVLGLADAMRK